MWSCFTARSRESYGRSSIGTPVVCLDLRRCSIRSFEPPVVKSREFGSRVDAEPAIQFFDEIVQSVTAQAKPSGNLLYGKKVHWKEAET